jgi:hypothetical protein
LRLLEPPDSSHEALRERVYSGSYDKPFVVDNGRGDFCISISARFKA